ncbi:hypothetical protein I6N90_00500 [Paenibacillus sp. GSMTC-2017]|uniref:hypothetical protein n=1 Tax=Paenibacillus sp. GSMTC-2017 TaxID=2794350 RepID=UPI0018D884D0|nr:hypothetical protein [Paenibacillus sp. GSMTC-2017]MBH5316286.1 hypothetical protein [Paenibacillus sp. GSMTC-2017]
MPKVRRKKVYDAVYNASKRYFSKTDPHLLNRYRKKLDARTAMLRYVTYYNFQPQFEQSGRTIWTQPQNDIDNRWTGVGGDEQIGKQGLYLSLEEEGSHHTNFPEIEHYQDPTLPANQEISYFEYEAGRTEAKWQKSKVSELRTMFLFESNKELNGFDFTYNQEPDHMFTEIFEEARKESPDDFLPDETVESLYFHPEDASFNRAIGNAALEVEGIDFFTATSVRDQKSINLILGGNHGSPINTLEPRGRNTFLIDGITKKSRSVYTVDDLIYNDTFDEAGVEAPMTVEELERNWSHLEEYAKKIDADLDWETASIKIDAGIHQYVVEALQQINDPFSLDMDKLTEQLASNELLTAVEKSLSDFVVTSAATSSESFVPLYKEIGLEGVRSVLNKEIVEPQYEKLVAKDGSHSYISLAVRSELADRKSHFLEQNASDIQKRLSEANTTVNETSTELTTKQESLNQLQEELERKPEDTDLKQEVDALRLEINRMTNELHEAELKREQAEHDVTNNDSNKRETSEELERLKEQRDERRREMERR